MYPRETVVRRNGKTYRYVKIVHGYRRADGVSTQRVIANLGRMSRQAFENLRMAFRASREGKAVVIPDKTLNELKRDKVKANLRYLDVAIMHEMWEAWSLGPVLSDLIGDEETVISTCDVIESLTLQRCVEPRSKLYAQEWLPTTALPELLGIPLKRFNNTRVHRALNTLYECTPQLQKKLTDLYQDRQAAFAAMFLDVTDTYFEGRGCESAKRSRTKAGHRNKWCIGIVLLANEKGFPLRWTVIPGKTKDHTAMAEMIADIRDLHWAKGVPLVCDRAMGQQTSVKNLHDTGLHFLTAAHADAIESYTVKLPREVLSKAEIEGTERSRKKDIERAVECVDEVEGLEKVDDHLFVMDLGVVAWLPEASGERKTPKGGKTSSRRRRRGRSASGIQERLRNARRLQAKIDGDELGSIKELARSLGVSPPRVSQQLSPLRLSPQIQQSILALKEDVPVSEARLQEILKARNAREQEKVFQVILGSVPEASTGNETNGKACPEPSQMDEDEQKAYSLRLVAYFNPQMFVDQRRRAQEHLDELQEFIAELNTELAKAKRSRKDGATRRKIVRRLEKNNYLDLFDVSLEQIHLKRGKVTSFRCKLTLKRDAWERRHRYNGFVLLLAHPNLQHSAKELALLYRAKDVVEKDFQCIKSAVKLRPIFHRKDSKVAAHVSLCMLALLLERSLEHQLLRAGLKQTAPLTIDLMATCHLNLMRPGAGGACFYSVTDATRPQQRVLKALGLSRLADDKAVAAEIAPRFVTT